eukprot:6694037-Prymnesium_polylepis.2
MPNDWHRGFVDPRKVACAALVVLGASDASDGAVLDGRRCTLGKAAPGARDRRCIKRLEAYRPDQVSVALHPHEGD